MAKIKSNIILALSVKRCESAYMNETDKAVKNAYEEIRIQRDASRSLAKELQTTREDFSREYHVIAMAYDKAMACIRVRFPHLRA